MNNNLKKQNRSEQTNNNNNKDSVRKGLGRSKTCMTLPLSLFSINNLNNFSSLFTTKYKYTHNFPKFIYNPKVTGNTNIHPVLTKIYLKNKNKQQPLC